MSDGRRIELIPVEPIASLRGKFAGGPPFEWEADRL